MGRCASIRVDNARLQAVCSAGGLDLLSSVVDLICLSIWGFSALNDCHASNPRLDALEATLARRSDRASMLELKVASKDTDIVAKTTQLSSLEGRVKREEGGIFLMLATLPELKTKLTDAEVAYSTVSRALLLVQVQLESIKTSGPSLEEEVARLQSDNTRLNKKCKLAVSLGWRYCDLLESINKDSRTLCECLCIFRVQYDQELTDLC